MAYTLLATVCLVRCLRSAQVLTALAGVHGFNGYAFGKISLTPGLHAIEMDYFQVRTCQRQSRRMRC